MSPIVTPCSLDDLLTYRAPTWQKTPLATLLHCYQELGLPKPDRDGKILTENVLVPGLIALMVYRSVQS